MSLSSQLKNSNDAKIIVGYHGSGLVNAILFGSKNLKLIEIFNKYYQILFLKLWPKTQI